MIFKVLNYYIAAELMDKGFKCIGTERNLKEPWLYTYKFDDTEAFQKEFQAIVARRKRERQ